MLQTRHCSQCGQEFTEEGFHLMCPKCRKMIQREKERIRRREAKPVTTAMRNIDGWLPQ